MNLKDKYNFIANIILTLFFLSILNLKILIYKIFFRKKIFFFYHPKSNLNRNHIFYIEDLFNNVGKNIVIFFGCEPYGKFQPNLEKNRYLFDLYSHAVGSMGLPLCLISK